MVPLLCGHPWGIGKVEGWPLVRGRYDDTCRQNGTVDLALYYQLCLEVLAFFPQYTTNVQNGSTFQSKEKTNINPASLPYLDDTGMQLFLPLALAEA